MNFVHDEEYLSYRFRVAYLGRWHYYYEIFKPDGSIYQARNKHEFEYISQVNDLCRKIIKRLPRASIKDWFRE
jgi:hypothetical protein